MQLQEPFTDDEGNLMSRPVTDAEGNPVLCQEAVAARDALIEKLAALPPVSEPETVRGSTRPATGQNRSLILSTLRGALQIGGQY